MSASQRGTIQAITAKLEEGPHSVRQLAFALPIPEMGICACLRGLHRDRKVKRTPPKPGKPSTWWLA